MLKQKMSFLFGRKTITNSKNVIVGYAVSYTTKCISNLEEFAQEMMTLNQEVADTLLL